MPGQYLLVYLSMRLVTGELQASFLLIIAFTRNKLQYNRGLSYLKAL